MSPSPCVRNDHKFEIHFITITVVEWIDIFTSEDYYKLLADSLNYCIRHKGLIVYEYVFMTNHIHLMVQADTTKSNGLDNIIRDFKCFTTKQILQLASVDNRHYIFPLLRAEAWKKDGNESQVWQANNCPIVIMSNKFYQQKANYIWENPVRKGYVKTPQDWKYSSAAQKLGNSSNDQPIKCADYT